MFVSSHANLSACVFLLRFGCLSLLMQHLHDSPVVKEHCQLILPLNASWMYFKDQKTEFRSRTSPQQNKALSKPSGSDGPNLNPPPVCSFLQQVPIANGTTNPCSSSKCEVKLELSFEYLMSKDRLQWVTITSQQVRISVGVNVTVSRM